jgi:hypothetical protein
MVAAALPRPGVEIVQTFASTSPTILIPTLVPVNVGPFFEVIDALQSDGTVNSAAALASPYAQLGLTIPQSSFPAPRGNIAELNVDEDSVRCFFNVGGALQELSRTSGFLITLTGAHTGGTSASTAAVLEASGATYPVSVDGVVLRIAHNTHNAVGVSLPDLANFPAALDTDITLEGAAATIVNVIDQINAVFPGMATNNSGQLRLTSSKFGAQSSVCVKAVGANVTLGFTAVDQVAVGAGLYAIDDGDSDPTSARIEFFMGAETRDAGDVNVDVTGVTAPNFVTNQVQVGDAVTADGVAIGLVQTVTASRLVMSIEQNIMSAAAGGFAPRYAWVQANGLVFPAPAASTAAVILGTEQAAVASVAAITSAAGTYPYEVGQTITYEVWQGGVSLGEEILTSDSAYANAATAATALDALATNVVITDSGTSLVFTALAANTGSGSRVTFSSESVGDGATGFTPGDTDIGENIRFPANLNGEVFEWSLDNNAQEYSVMFSSDEDDGGVSLQQVLDLINGETPLVATESLTSARAVLLTSGMVGAGSAITIRDGSANDVGGAGLGFTDDSTTVGLGRPAPDFAMDISGNAIIQDQILRDALQGVPFVGVGGQAVTYLQHKALRLDLSAQAAAPGLLTVNDTAALASAANPVTTENPGALMTHLCLLNSPGSLVKALGVSATSSDAPNGTPAAYAEAASFLEAQEVYSIAAATDDPVVHQAFLTHVTTMSAPKNKGERIYFFSSPEPVRALNTIYGSGNDANTTPTPKEVTIEVNIATALINAGIDPANVNPSSGAIVNEVYLDIAGDANNYLIESVTGGVTILVRTTFASTENTDAFFTTVTPAAVVSDDWSVALRGALLLNPGTTDPNKQLIAETVSGYGAAIQNRRGFNVFPNSVGINITGLEQIVAGHFATACISGMVANQPPAQPFTNLPITGLTKVQGSHDRFTENQMDVMAGGGTYILVQDTETGPVVCRHQLSTDTTTIEKRELSITKAIDFTAKFLRTGLKNFIGRNNITTSFLDQISTVVQGLIDFLVDGGVLAGASINNIIQDSAQPDRILIDVVLDVQYPSNYIRLTLVV